MNFILLNSDTSLFVIHFMKADTADIALRIYV